MPRTVADQFADILVAAGVKRIYETGPVLLSDAELRVNAVAYLAQHLIVQLDPADIVVGPSATADIEGVLIRDAQGARCPAPREWDRGSRGG